MGWIMLIWIPHLISSHHICICESDPERSFSFDFWALVVIHGRSGFLYVQKVGGEVHPIPVMQVRRFVAGNLKGGGAESAPPPSPQTPQHKGVILSSDKTDSDLNGV